MKIINLKSFFTIALLSLPVPAMAGFEFMPPVQKQMSAPAAEISVPPAMDNFSEMQDVAPMPVAPVVEMPLASVPPAPVPQNVVAAAPKPYAPAMVRESAVKKSGGLVIDPYPLRSKSTAPVANNKISQAITEKSGGLNPVQLGGGMTTGVNMNGKRISTVAVDTQTKSISPIGVSSLTPMMGNEPAPLPGYGYDQVERQPMRQYAQAVGFGKNLPLALAISQVVPSEFTHRFDGDVDASIMVDWDGGKPWNLVLEDMLRDENMTADIQGNVVVIKQTAKI